jgi:hypothetical protein
MVRLRIRSALTELTVFLSDVTGLRVLHAVLEASGPALYLRGSAPRIKQMFFLRDTTGSHVCLYVVARNSINRFHFINATPIGLAA